MKRWVALLLVMLMVFSIAACGGSGGGSDDPGNGDDPGNNGDDPDNGDDVDDPGNGDDIDDPGGETDSGDTSGLDGQFYNYDDDSFEVFKDFKELEYTFITGSGENKDEFTLSYSLVGEDSQLDARQFDILVYEKKKDKETEIELWVDEDAKAVKIGFDGNYFTGEMAEAYSYLPLTYLVWFTAFTQSYSDIFIEGKFEEEGWVVKDRSTVTRDFGSGNVKVERFELLYSWVGDDVTWTWEVAEIGGKFLFTVWKWSYGAAEYDMNVKKVIPH